MVLEKTLKSPLDCKEIQPVHSEGDQPWDFFGHLMRRVDSLEKTLILGGIGGRRKRGTFLLDIMEILRVSIHVNVGPLVLYVTNILSCLSVIFNFCSPFGQVF